MHIPLDVQRIRANGRQFITKVNNDWTANMASALAYSLITSIIPLVIAMISLIGLVLGSISSQSILSIEEQVQTAIPSSQISHALIQNILTKLPHYSSVFGLISLVSSLFFGTRLFILLEGCFGIIYRTHSRSMFKQNVMSVGVLCLFTVLVLCLAVVSSLTNGLTLLMKQRLMFSIPLIAVTSTTGSLIVAYLLFLFLYYLVPNRRMQWNRIYQGAGIAALLLEAYLHIFPFYTAHFLQGYVGQIGFVFIILAFFYYVAYILLLGAEFNAFFIEHIHPTAMDIPGTMMQETIDRE